MSSKEEQLLSEVAKKLDVLIRLSALNLVREMKSQKDQIGVLSDAAFQPKQIADILGTTSNTVSVTLHGIKKEREAKAKKETAKAEPTGEAPAKSTEETTGEHGERKGEET